jgi:hypothetical protein
VKEWVVGGGQNKGGFEYHSPPSSHPPSDCKGLRNIDQTVKFMDQLEEWRIQIYGEDVRKLPPTVPAPASEPVAQVRVNQAGKVNLVRRRIPVRNGSVGRTRSGTNCLLERGLFVL